MIIKSTDFICSNCTITCNQAEAVPPPRPRPVAGRVIQKVGRFTEVLQIESRDYFTYEFTLESANYCFFNIHSVFDAKLDIQVFQNNHLVAEDVNGSIKPNFDLSWKGQKGALVQVKVKSTDNIASACIIRFNQNSVDLESWSNGKSHSD